MIRIVAVIVLYKIPLTESPTYRALSQELKKQCEFGKTTKLLIYDNSPEPQTPADDFEGEYLHDGENPGLARRYNEALSKACACGATWLLLLDQDTILVPEYFEELMALSRDLDCDARIAAVVPKLIRDDGHLWSPHAPLYRRPERRIDSATRGVAGGIVRAFNSGALLRVDALTSIGGFPEAYWLDYLDHATFHRIQARGGVVYIMDVQLCHDMSTYAPDHNDPATGRRQRSQLQAELRFYREHGTLRERCKHRIDLVRKAYHSAKRGTFAEVFRLMGAAFSPAPKTIGRTGA